MILNRAPRTILMLNRVILNTSRSLVYNRPIASTSLVTVLRSRPAVRLLSTSTNNTSSDTSSPLGKASSEMHGGGDKESRTINESSSSEAEEEQQTSDEPLETVILKTAMNFVPELGFTDEAISRG
jgi:hypothetical protein